VASGFCIRLRLVRLWVSGLASSSIISLNITASHDDIPSDQVLHLDPIHLLPFQPVIMTLNQFFGYGDRLEAMFHKDVGYYLRLERDLLGIHRRS